MSMGKKPSDGRQQQMWVATEKLPQSPGHPFYERLNRVLAKVGFDAFVEKRCARFFADRLGGPCLAARTILPATAGGGKLRWAEFGACHRLASIGFGERASPSGIRPGGGCAESFDLVEAAWSYYFA